MDIKDWREKDKIEEPILQTHTKVYNIPQFPASEQRGYFFNKASKVVSADPTINGGRNEIVMDTQIEFRLSLDLMAGKISPQDFLEQFDVLGGGFAFSSGVFITNETLKGITDRINSVDIFANYIARCIFGNTYICFKALYDDLSNKQTQKIQELSSINHKVLFYTDFTSEYEKDSEELYEENLKYLKFLLQLSTKLYRNLLITFSGSGNNSVKNIPYFKLQGKYFSTQYNISEEQKILSGKLPENDIWDIDLQSLHTWNSSHYITEFVVPIVLNR
jgi:hypothetical protein